MQATKTAACHLRHKNSVDRVLEDFIRNSGTPNELLSDNTKY
jgi:hypothetical protein